ncbi:MAG: tetratricopeptide repeat protein [Proteobacteria bacterium]|nr:tetratricopeptide repeat protein [Pseudomonadota bacterium]
MPLPDKPSVAVLAFDNLSGDHEQEYFADGIVEDIIAALARFRWLFIIARNSSFTYKGKSVDVKQIGRDLGVRYVVEGSLRKAGNKVRISAQLIDTTTGAHVWSDRFEGALEDIFELQDRVVASIVGTIQPELRQAEIERVRRKPTESLDAYDFYLRGLSSFQGRNRESMDDALTLFKRAAELDPEFAAAHGMAAYCLALRRSYGWSASVVAEDQEIRGLVAQATDTGRNDPVALYAAGWALAFIFHDLEGGAALIDRALNLNSNDAVAWGISAMTLAWRGKPELALEHAARSIRLSPRDPLNFLGHTAMALSHIYVGQYEDAVACIEKCIRDYPEAPATLRIGAVAYANLGYLDKARALAARLLALNPDYTLSKHRALFFFQRPQDAERMLQGLRLAGIPE